MQSSQEYKFFGVELTLYLNYEKWVTCDVNSFSDCWIEFDKLAYQQLTTTKQRLFSDKLEDLINENRK